MQSFDELSLPLPIANALKELKFSIPTPIQAKTIPIALTGVDLIGCAQTGTGKTAAFAIPSVVRANEKPGTKVLILTPTRELAEQIIEVIYKLTEFLPHMRMALLIGGASMNRQLRDLKQNPTFIVGTPGRVFDHLDRGTLNLTKVATVILDEADRMLDMGFAPQIDRIFKFLPRERQTLLFSATLPPHIMKLTARYLKNPERVAIGTIGKPISAIQQSSIEVNAGEKNQRILEELGTNSGTTLIFARTKMRTDRLSRFLEKNGISAEAIHGGRSQSQRRRALEAFRNGDTNILVATDVASRGLDIPHIETVINFDLPQSTEDYVHRIGRTARAGAKGAAISFVTPEERGFWKSLKKIA